MSGVVVVYVHGIFSNGLVWDDLRNLAVTDEDLPGIEHLPYDYSSPRTHWNPLQRIPDFGDIAEGLGTFLENECESFDKIILVTHSQGGLILQRYLAQMLQSGRGFDLYRIKRVVMFACPNAGSNLFSPARRFARIIWRHPQEKSLRVLAADVAESHRFILKHVVNATQLSESHCPIPMRAYVGMIDNVVKPASARGSFPECGTIKGDHSTIIRPGSSDDTRYKVFKNEILQAVTGDADPMPLEGEALFQGFPAPIYRGTELNPPEVKTIIARKYRDGMYEVVYSGDDLSGYVVQWPELDREGEQGG